jgi:hypothetical protein
MAPVCRKSELPQSIDAMAAMNHLARVLLLWLLFAVSSGAEAQQIREMTGFDIALGEFSGVLYCVPDADAYHVVATVSSGDRATPLRFIATLAEGQSVVFSVPGKMGEPERRLKVARTRDRLLVTDGQ